MMTLERVGKVTSHSLGRLVVELFCLSCSVIRFTHCIIFPIQPVLQYLIFPAQFAYLYSFHPTGNMGDLPSDLETKWEKKHITDAEKAFARVAEEGQSTAAPSFFKIAETETVSA